MVYFTEDFDKTDSEIHTQGKQRYAVITVGESSKDPFVVIPNAYKTLQYYIEVNGMKEKREKGILSCFEREYDKDGCHMDIYIAVES